jgi:hypothetical protein
VELEVPPPPQGPGGVARDVTLLSASLPTCSLLPRLAPWSGVPPVSGDLSRHRGSYHAEEETQVGPQRPKGRSSGFPDQVPALGWTKGAEATRCGASARAWETRHVVQASGPDVNWESSPSRLPGPYTHASP